MKTLRIIFSIFLLGLIVSVPTVAYAADSDDIINTLEKAKDDLTAYVTKIELKQEIASLETEIENLKTDKEELIEKYRNLEKENEVTSNKVVNLKQAEDDRILTAVVILLFFSLAGFASSLLLINVIWRKKIRGIR
ncbi:hypothetical protein ACFLWS_04030 [Chloroflexota bacterium]